MENQVTGAFQGMFGETNGKSELKITDSIGKFWVWPDLSLIVIVKCLITLAF